MTLPLSILAPGAMPPVPVSVPADAWDNIIREWGVGYCNEWFGHAYDSDHSYFTAEVLLERAALARVQP